MSFRAMPALLLLGSAIQAAAQTRLSETAPAVLVAPLQDRSVVSPLAVASPNQAQPFLPLPMGGEGRVRGLAAAPSPRPSPVNGRGRLSAAASAFKLSFSVLDRAARAPEPERLNPAAQGRFWDGISASLAASEPEDGDDGMYLEHEPATGEASAAAPARPQDELELRFSRDAKERLKNSELYATVRLVGGSGSQWHWGRFLGDVPIRVLVGGRTLFHSRVLEGATKAIKDLSKDDLQGVFPANVLRHRTTDQLRKRLIDDLTRYGAYRPGQPTVVTPESLVRVVRFMNWAQSRDLDENRPEEAYVPRPRTAVDVPAKLTALHAQPPKVVFIDMRGVGDSVGPDLLEDLAKLQKAGQYFVLFTDKPLAGPGSLDEQLTAGLTTRQREELVRYKLFAVTESGNRMHEYRGSYPRALPLSHFRPLDVEMLEWLVHTQSDIVGRNPKTEEKRISRVAVSFDAGTDLDAAAKTLAERLDKHGVDAGRLSLRRSAKNGRAVVAIRPNALPRSLQQALTVLREEHHVYANPSDVLLLTDDKALLAALPGAATVQRYAPKASGRGLVELGLAAMLGSYRENLPGDLAASASKISQFLRDPDVMGGGDRYNIHMLLGHVMHATFNWALWIRRNTGELPPGEELVNKAMQIFRHEDAQRTLSFIEKPGESVGGYLVAMRRHLLRMYEILGSLLKEYPIVIGTELPNFHVFERLKNEEIDHRDILRYIFDAVLARETKAGLDYLIVDFKTGQTYTMQPLAKDTQVELYDQVAPRKWGRLSVPYGLTGLARKAALIGVEFIFPPGSYQPEIDDWDQRLPFERWLPQVMNRMRRHAAKAAAPAPQPSETKDDGKKAKKEKKS